MSALYLNCLQFALVCFETFLPPVIYQEIANQVLQISVFHSPPKEISIIKFTDSVPLTGIQDCPQEY